MRDQCYGASADQWVRSDDAYYRHRPIKLGVKPDRKDVAHRKRMTVAEFRSRHKHYRAHRDAQLVTITTEAGVEKTVRRSELLDGNAYEAVAKKPRRAPARAKQEGRNVNCGGDNAEG